MTKAIRAFAMLALVIGNFAANMSSSSFVHSLFSAPAPKPWQY